MTRCIVMAFHKYTPFGDEFYEPMLNFQLNNLQKYENEYDKLYLIDSNWEIPPDNYDIHIMLPKIGIIKVNPSLRYADAYNEILPQIKEDLVLFMDNDMVVYKPGMIKDSFALIDPEEKGTSMVVGHYQVATIIDQIGTYETDKLMNGNKFCPYWFATRKDLLMKYRDVEWGDHMPHSETLGLLTEAMLNDGIKAYEMEDDKSDATFENGEVKTQKNFGYYHVRAGSTPAVLLAWKHSSEHEKTYWDYIENQPHSEIVRHCQWYAYMGGNPKEIYDDL